MAEDQTLELLTELVGELRQHNIYMERWLVKALDLAPASPPAEPFDHACSFCGKPRTAVRQMVVNAERKVSICDECSDEVVDTMRKQKGKAKVKAQAR